MLKYNKKETLTIKSKTKNNLSYFLGSMWNICFDLYDGRNRVDFSTSRGHFRSEPLSLRSTPYKFTVPRIGYFINRNSSIYEAYMSETIPMSTMVKSSKIYKDNR